MAAVRGASRIPVEIAPARPVRRFSRVGIALLTLSAVFFGVNFGHEWLLSRQYQQQAVQLQADIASTTAQNQQLQSELSYYNSKQYIIPAARAMLGMARPNDTLMQVRQLPPRTKVVRILVPASPSHESIFIHLLRSIFQ